MNETITKPQGSQDVQAIESETVLTTESNAEERFRPRRKQGRRRQVAGEPELLLPIDEYAARHEVSRRTVDRYVKCGRLDSTKSQGRTMIVDKPLKPSAQDTGQSPKEMDVQIVTLARTDLIRLGYLQARSKSKTLWQTYAIMLTVLFVALLMVSLWLFTQWRFLTSP